MKSPCGVLRLSLHVFARYAVDHFGGDQSAVPTHATSIGLATVMRARQHCLVVVGAGKVPLLHARSVPVWVHVCACVCLCASVRGIVWDCVCLPVCSCVCARASVCGCQCV